MLYFCAIAYKTIMAVVEKWSILLRDSRSLTLAQDSIFLHLTQCQIPKVYIGQNHHTLLGHGEAEWEKSLRVTYTGGSLVNSSTNISDSKSDGRYSTFVSLNCVWKACLSWRKRKKYELVSSYLDCSCGKVKSSPRHLTPFNVFILFIAHMEGFSRL